MLHFSSRALVVVAVGLLSGCAGKSTPPTPPAPPPLPLPTVRLEQSLEPVRPAPVTPLDAVSRLIGRAEGEFDAGRAEFERGHLVAARAHFDRATDLLLEQPGGVKSDPRLQTSFEKMVERITALELRALREADGITEARTEPAALDELLSVALFEKPTPKATTAETVAADLAASPRDIPIDVNQKVLSYVELYQGRLREFLQAGLNRGQQYLPMIRSVFAQEGLPLSLAYIPLVESAFKNTATSRVSARGMWQFMLPTAKEHGLHQDWFVDERSDPEKATRAAAQYLKTVIAMFDGDWALAIASYNGGPGRMMGAMRRSKSTDFWKISSTSRYLPRETREYVPMILASMIIAGNPELYGFEVASAAPLAYETVEVPGAMDLKIIAEWADITLEDLQALNPDLRRTTTPMRKHLLRLPIGTAATVQHELANVEPGVFRTFRFHTVQPRETVATIAKKYKVSTTSLRELNDLSATARVKTRQTLAIPEPSANTLPAPTASAASPVRQTAQAAPLVYRVRAGDTLFGIAQRFGTTVESLRSLNKLKSDSIGIGLTLTIRR